MENNVSTPSGIDAIKDAIKPASLIDKIHASKDLLIEIGIYSLIGFLCGFLFKRYNRYLIVGVFFILILFLLHTNGILHITFYQSRLNELLGVQTPDVNSDIGISLWEWIKAHVITSLCFLVGFLCGMRLG